MREIEQIRAGCEAATPGLWESTDDADQAGYKRDQYGASILVKCKEDSWCDLYVIEGGEQDEQGAAIGVLRNADAAFIAHARQDIPDLLAALEAKDAEIEQLTNALDAAVELFEDECTPNEQDAFVWKIQTQELLG